MVTRMRVRRALLLAFSLFLAAPIACSKPDGLRVGDCEISYQAVIEADTELAVSFPMEGIGSRRWHLLEFGMGEAALLHHALPSASTAALEQAAAGAERLATSADVEATLSALREENGQPEFSPEPLQPYPSALGGRIAAAVAAREAGDWAGPLQTAQGWSLVYLKERMDGPRNRANVLVYVVDYPVGAADDRARAQEEWGKLPLSGNPELLDALPLEFRRGRTRDTR